MKPESVLMLKEANRRGLGPISPEECQLVKERMAPLAQPDFVKAEASSTDFIDRLPKVLRPAAKKTSHPHPENPQSRSAWAAASAPKAAPSTPSRSGRGRL